MSIVFAMILGLYAAMRLGFWVRGQYRLRLGAAELPALAPVHAAPPHLRPELRLFFEHCTWVNAELCRQRRAIAMARVSDPDHYYGFVRDPRYRRAVLEAARALRAWIQQTESFFGKIQRRSQPWPVSPECAQSTLLAMEPQLREVARARALEPFSLQDVDAFDKTLRSFLSKLEYTLECLDQSQAVSYRQGPTHSLETTLEPG